MKKVKNDEQKSIINSLKNETRIYIIIIFILLVSLIVFVSLGKKVKLVEGKEVIASIKGLDITAEKLFEETKSTAASAILLNLIDKEIIKKEKLDLTKIKEDSKKELDTLKANYTNYGQDFASALESNGFKNEEEFLERLIFDNQKKEVVKKYLTKDLKDEDIKKYYDNDFSGKVSAKHILIKFNAAEDATDEVKKQDEQDALNKAKDVINKLNNGESFDALVKEYSGDTASVEKNGLYENFMKGDMVDEFYSEALRLKNNEYSKKPVKTTYGYHILLKINETPKPSFKDAEKEIKNILVTKTLSSSSTVITSTWVKIREEYKFKINDSVIKKVYNESIKQD